MPVSLSSRRCGRLPPPPFVLAVLLLLASGWAAAADTLRFCTDQIDWKPFVYVVKGQPQGRHIDLAQRAVEAAGLQVQILPMPWLRCQLEAREGKVDGLLSLVFSATRDLAYHYPADASVDGLSRWSLEDIADVVVTLDTQTYAYAGDPASLPRPVRVPRGWEIGPFLRSRGVEVEDGAPSDEANLIKLLRDGSGSVIANADTVRLLQAQSSQFARLRVSATPVRSQSYFLAFSRAAQVPVSTREAIWNAIAEQRWNRTP